MALSTTLSKLRRRSRLIANGALCTSAYHLLKRKHFDGSDTVLIFGSIRSGSTWLTELLTQDLENLQLFEPLHPEYVSRIASLGLSRIPYVAPEDPWQDGKTLFEDLVSGRLINSWILSQTSVSRVTAAQRLVIKMVRGNLLLPWYTQHFDLRKPVLIIRHPCAIVASHLRKGWPPSRHLLLSHPYFDQHTDIRDSCSHLERPEELAALAWCLRYHGALTMTPPDRYCLISYESLVQNSDSELDKISVDTGLHISAQTREKAGRPSDTSTAESAVSRGENPLTGWHGQLDQSQINAILSVLNIFGMHFYSNAPECDEKELIHFASQGPVMTPIASAPGGEKH